MITTPFQNALYLGVAMFILLLSVAIIVIGIILIHELPYRIAKRRGHPQQDAIRCMAIMGLILLPLWLLSMIWAYMCSGVSYLGGSTPNSDVNTFADGVDSNIDLENKQKPTGFGDEIEEGKTNVAVCSDILEKKKGRKFTEPDKNNTEVESKGSNKKTADKKDDNTGN